jgi:hypothetical protein
MKVCSFLVVLLFINMNSYSQKVKYISKYFTHYDTVNSMDCFKIRNNTLNFNDKAVYINKKVVLEKDTSSFFFLEVYLNKVLIVSYYPMSQAHVSTGPGFRPIQKVEFVLLRDPTQRWLFDLKGAFNSQSIIDFNELTGELELKRKIKGQKL